MVRKLPAAAKTVADGNPLYESGVNLTLNQTPVERYVAIPPASSPAGVSLSHIINILFGDGSGGGRVLHTHES